MLVIWCMPTLCFMVFKKLGYRTYVCVNVFSIFNTDSKYKELISR